MLSEIIPEHDELASGGAWTAATHFSRQSVGKLSPAKLRLSLSIAKRLLQIPRYVPHLAQSYRRKQPAKGYGNWVDSNLGDRSPLSGIAEIVSDLRGV